MKKSTFFVVVGPSSRKVSTGSAPTSPAFQRKKAMSMVFNTKDSNDANDHNSSLRPNLASHQMMSSSLTSFDRREVDEEYDDDDDVDGIDGPQSLPFHKRSTPTSASGGSYFQR